MEPNSHPPPPVSSTPARGELPKRVFTLDTLSSTQRYADSLRPMYFERQNDDASDDLPALYHFSTSLGTNVDDPSSNLAAFLETELSFGDLHDMLNMLWLFAPKRAPRQIHLYVAMGQQILVAESMGLHLLWDEAAIFFKPIPRFLLNPDFWQTTLRCPESCACSSSIRPVEAGTASLCLSNLRKVALGFLYTYACLVSSENDFAVANEHRLLPRMPDGSTIKWKTWKTFARELRQTYDPNKIHRRFLCAELRYVDDIGHLWASERNIISRRSALAVSRGLILWLTAYAAIAALVLTAMQVGLATTYLQGNDAFQLASFIFTVFVLILSTVAVAIFFVWNNIWFLKEELPRLKRVFDVAW